jgi:hypothetical protein
VQLNGDGLQRVGIELTSRLSTLEMQLLKQLGQPEDKGKKLWV